MPVQPQLPGADSGFSVDPALLGGAAGQLGKAWNDLGTAIGQYTGRAAPSAEDFGGQVSANWAHFHSAWENELGVLRLAVLEMIHKVVPPRSSG